MMSIEAVAFVNESYVWSAVECVNIMLVKVKFQKDTFKDLPIL